jgi:solute carrier family 25 thiamine pyrophosphate transporter 19
MHVPADDKEPGRETKKSRITLDATAGALAGCIARFIVGPLDVVKIRFQVQLEPIVSMPQGPSKYTGIGQALATIIKEEGIQVRLAGGPSLRAIAARRALS